MVTFDFIKTPITQIADYIILYAAKSNASDIHFDPREDGMMVRIRVDGDLQDYTKIPKTYERNLTTRLKLLASMNITESRLPQDGAIKGNFSGTYLDMRVSSLPLNEGEKIVIRILDYSKSLEGIESLGFNDKNLVKLKRMMGVPNGIILVTGATGSGKSTTTYSILQALNKPEINIITVEDPIEMNIQGLNQVQVNSEIGMTFAAALRSILRQDPNVILIGEIRDSETAQIAVRASITGHLVLSTIHTNNTLATVERLLDMNVERYLLSSALTGIISQRLAKKICSKCRFKRETTKYEKKVFRHFMKEDIAEIWDANPDGCNHCRKGYKGRVAIQEVLEIDDDIRDALSNEKLEKDDLREMVYTENIITMLQDALGKVLDGLTSFEEVYRVIEIESDDDNDNYSAELTKAFDDRKINKEEKAITNNDIKEETKTNVTTQVQSIISNKEAEIKTAPQTENKQTIPPIRSVAPSNPPIKKVETNLTTQNNTVGQTVNKPTNNVTTTNQNKQVVNQPINNVVMPIVNQPNNPTQVAKQTVTNQKTPIPVLPK